MRSEEPSAAADRLAEKLMVAAVATGGHALLLGFKFLRNGHVNSVSLIVLGFMAACTAAGYAYLLRLRRRPRP